jgi:putative membrane protein
MRQLMIAERFCLIGHLVSMAFGLAGLLWVAPHPEVLALLPAGETMFRWSMAGGGVVYILLGAIAVILHAYRTLGWRNGLIFMISAIVISLSSELMGTSIGFPFGHYSYLSGLGYKISGLVPFTIPLSWFYLGLSSYLLAWNGLTAGQKTREGRTPSQSRWLVRLGAIVLGALLLTSWDFVLDPAMSQTAMPFWYWHQPGAFFGMPYQNFAGWMGTGITFMMVAVLLWRNYSPRLLPAQLNLPLAVYLGNFAFATIMSLASDIWVPVLLGLLLGVIPAVSCWLAARSPATESPLPDEATREPSESFGTGATTTPVGVSLK